MDSYELQICGLTRTLPLMLVGRKTRIASFSILGDVELCDALSDEMAKRLANYEFDFIVGPEVKSVPLVHGVAKRLGHSRYVVCRKSIKSYMRKPVKVDPLSHFPKHVKPLVVNGTDAELLVNKRVVILDDVISTGVTIRMMKYLMKKVGAETVATMAAIKQGEQFDKNWTFEYLVETPIFKSDS